MALTDKQKKNINNLDLETCIEILHECEERLGLVTVKEYCELFKQNKRTVYLHISQNKIHSIKLSNIIFLIINN